MVSLAVRANDAIGLFPEVGGGDSVSQGDSVTLSGSFGSAPTVAQSLRAAIEATGVGANISLTGGFNSPPINTNLFQGYNDPTRARAIRGLYESGDAFDVALSYDFGADVAANDIVVVDYRIRAQTIGPNVPGELNDQGGTTAPGTPGVSGWQWKLYRFRNNNDVLDAGTSAPTDEGDFYVPHWDNEDGSFFGGEFSGGHFINGDSNSPYINNTGTGDAGRGAGGTGRRAGGDDLPTLYTQTWTRVEAYFFMGNAGTGRTFLYCTHEGSERRLVGSIANANFQSGSRSFRYFLWQNYLGNAEDTGDDFNGTWLAMDDLYVQRGHTRRVILMSHSTLAASYGVGGWVEPQIVTNWTASELTVGSLNTGANRVGTCYLAAIETNVTTRNDTLLASREITVV